MPSHQALQGPTPFGREHFAYIGHIDGANFVHTLECWNFTLVDRLEDLLPVDFPQCFMSLMSRGQFLPAGF
jgi:hypothetical protein